MAIGFSPRAAIGSPQRPVVAEPEPVGRGRSGDRALRASGQGLHPLAGGRLGEAVGVGALGEHVGVVQQAVDGGRGQRLGA